MIPCKKLSKKNCFFFKFVFQFLFQKFIPNDPYVKYLYLMIPMKKKIIPNDPYV